MSPTRFTGKVALVTGAARGQGRAHALALAAEGADLILCDIGAGEAGTIGTLPYALGSEEGLAETAGQVRALGRDALTCTADVRDSGQVDGAVAAGLERFGQIDVLLANAGIASISRIEDMPDAMWREMIDINLTGVFNSLRAVAPHMAGRGYGRIVATSSIVGRQGSPNIGHYVAAKWGVIGLVKSLAIELADRGVTVNAVAPTSVDTEMIQNEGFWRLFLPDAEQIREQDVRDAYTALNPIPIPWLQAADVSHSVLFLASDEAKFITGEVLPVALGWNARNAS
ncbi:MAG: short-chain dehydrogenase/reductase [Solirubrobacterales bacterium]|nr:short-chain dehydrogenase/reductase [Solirubrobacterales bacterium]